MKKRILWGLGLVVAVGFIAYLFSTEVSWAKRAVGFDPTNSGAPGDSLSDNLHDRPGHDRNNDRTPDSTPDRVERSTIATDPPDCVGNIPGDGGNGFNDGSPDGISDKHNVTNCGSAGGSGTAGDLTPEDMEQEGVADAIPDASRYATVNRSHDRATDYVPDWPKSDTYLSKAGLSPIAGSEPGDLTPDGKTSDVKIFDNTRDAVGRDRGAGSQGDLTPDLVRDSTNRDATGDGVPSRPGIDRDQTTGPDGVPDGAQDRVNHRDRARHGGSQPSRDVVAVGFGPGDKTRDHASDQGGLSALAPGAGGGGGGGGCSYSTTGTADLGLMLAMLLPFMLAIGFRLARRAAK